MTILIVYYPFSLCLDLVPPLQRCSNMTMRILAMNITPFSCMISLQDQVWPFDTILQPPDVVLSKIGLM